MPATTSKKMLSVIEELTIQLGEAHEAINAIKSGSVDAFAMKMDGIPGVFTLQSLDYAYRVLIEKFSEGALSLTKDGLIVYSNSYFSELVAVPNEKVTGSNIMDYISVTSGDKFAEHFASALQGNSKTEITLSVNNKDIPVYISLTSLQPQLDNVGMIVTDLSEKKTIEQQIFNYTEALKMKNLELLHLNRSLDQFASIASHDLQEPLRKIKIFTSLLQQRFINDLPDGARELITKIRGATERMSMLIEAVLNFSRTVHTENLFVKTDLNKVLDNTITDFDLLILEKNATVIKEELPYIEANPVQINQLFYNLLGNALKFSKNGRPPIITISSRALSRADMNSDSIAQLNLNARLSYIEICFKDNGIGFEQQFAGKIFSIFERLNNQNQYSGTGIGLALCQKITEQHHGAIHAESTEDNGAVFYVMLPLQQPVNHVRH